MVDKMSYLINNQPITFDDKDRISAGREAIIYRKGATVYKVYVDSSHPSLKNDKAEQQAADERVRELAVRLKTYPLKSPFFVHPKDTISLKNNKIIGFTMPYLNGYDQLAFYFDNDYILKNQIQWSDRKKILSQLHDALLQAHQEQVILGDGMSPRNWMVHNNTYDVKGIDTLAYQYGTFDCLLLTDITIDPALLKAGTFEMIARYNKESDYYAYAVLVLLGLIQVHPYAGNLPMSVRKQYGITEAYRRAERLTIFDDRVRYPQGLPHWNIIHDDVLNDLYNIIVGDKRYLVDKTQLDKITWKTCTTCRTLHCRDKCPTCNNPAKPSIQQKKQITTSLEADMVFQTTGYIMYAQNNNRAAINYLYRDGNDIVQAQLDYNNGFGVKKAVLNINIESNDKVRFHKDTLIIGRDKHLYGANLEVDIDPFENTWAFDANDTHMYWLDEGYLKRDSYLKNTLHPQYVYKSELVANNTMFWVGQQHGLGFAITQAGAVVFRFNAKDGAGYGNIADSSQKYIWDWTHSLINSSCVFGGDLVYLHLHIQGQTGDETIIHKFDLNSNKLVNTISEPYRGIKGRVARGNKLYIPTDNGLEVLENSNITIYTETEPYINARSKLFFTPNGLGVVNNREIWVLRLK